MADRRAEIVEAAWRVIVRDGLERTSVRAVARELGASTGVVSHHFANKDDLLITALEAVFEETIDAAQAEARSSTGLARIENILVAALPTTEADRADWCVWVAFMGYSIGHEHLMAQHQQRYNRLQEFLLGEFHVLQQTGVLHPALDLEAEVLSLIALIDGIGIGAVVSVDRFPSDLQRTLVQHHLVRLASG
ncbi:MAG: TetR/AcrR family transcriptional regulator [Rhodothermales bacterium]